MFSMKSDGDEPKIACGKKEAIAGLKTFLSIYNQPVNRSFINNVSEKKKQLTQINRIELLAKALNKER